MDEDGLPAEVGEADNDGQAAPPAEVDEPRLLRSMRGGHGGSSSTADSACLTCCTYVRGRSQIACGAKDGSVLLWPASMDPEERHRRPTRLGGGAIIAGGGPATSSTTPSPATCVVASPTGDLIGVSSSDGAVRVWRNQAGRQTPTVLKVHFGPVRGCDLSPIGGRLVLSCADDKLVKISSLPDKRFVASLVGHTNWVQSAVFSPGTGEFAASGGDDRTVRLWDTERHAGLRVWHDHAGSVACVRFDPDGNAIAACSWDSSINIWDVRSHAMRQHYGRAHGSSPITQIAFHPCEDLLLSTSTDRTIRLWDLRAGRLRSTIRGHEKPVHACAWDEDGGRFVSCENNIVHLWSLPGGAKASRPAAAAYRSFSSPHTIRRSVAAPTPAAAWKPPGAAHKAAVDISPGSKPHSQPIAASCEEHASMTGGYPQAAPVNSAPVAEEAVKVNLPPSLIQAAWQGDDRPIPPAGVLVSQAAARAQQAAQTTPVGPPAAWQEEFAATLEKMVSKMDIMTQSLQSMEQRLAPLEFSVAEMASTTKARRAS